MIGSLSLVNCWVRLPAMRIPRGQELTQSLARLVVRDSLLTELLCEQRVKGPCTMGRASSAVSPLNSLAAQQGQINTVAKVASAMGPTFSGASYPVALLAGSGSPHRVPGAQGI